MRAGARSGTGAFTVVELLAAATILVLMLALLSQATDTVSRTWKGGAARIDNFAKARAVLDLLDRDVQSMVLRRDLAAFVDGGSPGNPACAFYSRTDGLGDRRLSLVSYSLANAASRPVLQRAYYSLDYAAAAPSLSVTNSLPDLVKATPQDVAEGVLLFQYQFLAGDGTFQPAFQCDYDHPAAATNTRAIVVSVLVLDDDALGVARQTGTLAALLGNFSGSPASGQTYARLWDAALGAPGFGRGLGEPLRAGVRVYERCIALP